MIEMEQLPVVWRNVRATKSWRPRDMVNWHRLVRPLREVTAPDSSFDFHHPVFDCCTNFAVEYQPGPAHGAPAAGPSFAAHRGRESVILFADAPDHTSGVATTLRQWSGQAEARGRDLSIFHCGPAELFRAGRT